MADATAVSLKPDWRLALPPLALGVLEVWHPVAPSGMPGDMRHLVFQDEVWIFVHLAQLVLFALTAWVVSRLLPAPRTTLSNVAKKSLAFFAVAYTAFDTFAGLATVTIVQASLEMQPPGPEIGAQLANAIFRSPINASLFVIGTGAWTVGVLLTARVLWQRGTSAVPVALLAASAVTLWGDHPPPFGPVTFGLTAAAILWLALAPGRSPGRRPVHSGG